MWGTVAAETHRCDINVSSFGKDFPQTPPLDNILAYESLEQRLKLDSPGAFNVIKMSRNLTRVRVPWVRAKARHRAKGLHRNHDSFQTPRRALSREEAGVRGAAEFSLEAGLGGKEAFREGPEAYTSEH